MNKKYFALVAICVLALTGSALGQELLSNPGFETWTAGAGGPPDSWLLNTSSFTATQEATIVHGGTYSCNITFTSTSNQEFIQEVAVTGGETYTFSFWALDNDAAGRGRVCIQWWGPNHTAYVGYYGSYTSDSPDWQQVSCEQTAPDTAVTARCMLRFYDVDPWDGDATIYIDDASFQEAVPVEPDTVSIYDIQYTTTVGSGCYDSPLVGEKVWTKGIVGYVFSGTYPDFYMQEGDGPFEGIMVYDVTIVPSVGDEVLLRADVVEYMGMTELQNIDDYTIVSTGNTPYGPTVVATGDFTGGCNYNGEQWEGMHVRVEDAYCTGWPNGYAEWFVCDGSGEAQIDDDHFHFDSPYPGQGFPFIQGFIQYSYSEYEILPTAECDFGTPFLAVELMSFDAAAGDSRVTLTWRTASEVDAHSFNIYRDEEIIASVPAFGDAHDYIYVDRDVQNGTEYTYQLGDVNLDGNETIHPMVCSVTPNAVPGSYALNQNYPNPFNPSTEISYALPTETHVTLAVYNLLGQEVATLVDQVKEAGQHTISWNATDNASGVYFYRLQTDDFSATKKMVFMK